MEPVRESRRLYRGRGVRRTLSAGSAVSDGVGVGPHPEPWPESDHLDPDLLRDGDRRNVVDRYRLSFPPKTDIYSEAPQKHRLHEGSQSF